VFYFIHDNEVEICFKARNVLAGVAAEYGHVLKFGIWSFYEKTKKQKKHSKKEEKIDSGRREGTSSRGPHTKI
jgi:hypothetical protein